MPTTIKIRVKRTGDLAEVKCLVVHPMETGLREDPETGEKVPRNHITQLTFANNGKTVLIANCSTSVSRNPYFNFSFAGSHQGDRFSAAWIDDKGEHDLHEIVVD